MGEVQVRGSELQAHRLAKALELNLCVHLPVRLVAWTSKDCNPLRSIKKTDLFFQKNPNYGHMVLKTKRIPKETTE